MEEEFCLEDAYHIKSILLEMSKIHGSYEGLSEIKERFYELENLIPSKCFKEVSENENLIQHYIDQIKYEEMYFYRKTEEEVIKESIRKVKADLASYENKEEITLDDLQSNPFFRFYYTFYKVRPASIIERVKKDFVEFESKKK